jgi:hypothetical protein
MFFIDSFGHLLNRSSSPSCIQSKSMCLFIYFDVQKWKRTTWKWKNKSWQKRMNKFLNFILNLLFLHLKKFFVVVDIFHLNLWFLFAVTGRVYTRFKEFKIMIFKFDFLFDLPHQIKFSCKLGKQFLYVFWSFTQFVMFKKTIHI